MANCPKINNTTIKGTSAVTYDSTPLPCTNVNTCDGLNTILAKFDAIICDVTDSVATLTEDITNATEDLMIIIDDVMNINDQLDICCPITTTTTSSSTSTSTSTSTTTSTTTIPPTTTTTSSSSTSTTTSSTSSTSTTTSTTTIPPTTTTTSSSTSSTTTTAVPTTTTTTTIICTEYSASADGFPGNIYYTDCSGSIEEIFVDTTYTFCATQGTVTSGGPIISIVGPCPI